MINFPLNKHDAEEVYVVTKPLVPRGIAIALKYLYTDDEWDNLHKQRLYIKKHPFQRQAILHKLNSYLLEQSKENYDTFILMWMHRYDAAEEFYNWLQNKYQISTQEAMQYDELTLNKLLKLFYIENIYVEK